VASNIFGLSHEQFIRNQYEMYYDRKHDAALQQVAEEAATAETAGAVGGGPPSDLGGDEPPLPGGPEEMPAGEAGAAEPEAGSEDVGLLAVPPGSRKSTRTYGRPEKSPPGNRDRRSDGAASRSIAASWGQGSTGTSQRSTLPGYRDGLATLGKGIVGMEEGVYGQNEPIYSLKEQTEEDKLFQINNSVRSLLESLENKNEDKTQ